MELNGLYIYGQNIGTDLGTLPGFDTSAIDMLAGLPGRDVKLHRYGGDIKFNIGRGAWFPFVTVGSGVLRFEPDGLTETESIYLSGGLGLQFSFRDRYTIVAQANSLSYRYNPGSAFLSADDLTATGLTAADFDVLDVNNITASVGVQFYLGGREPGAVTDLDRALERQIQSGIRGVALRIEPSAGEVDFADKLGLRNKQRFVGVAAGMDLGPLVSLRGFYWRGAEHDAWTTFDDIQAYGGEMKFTFNEARGSVTPYLLVGGGYMDVLSGYVGNGLVAPQDRPFGMGGVGVIVPMGDAMSIDVGVRSLLLSSEDVDNVSDPGQVESNTMFNVGLSFGIGGGAGTGGVFGREAAASRSEREQLASSLAVQERTNSQTQAQVDSLRAVVLAQQGEIAKVAEMASTPPAATPVAVAPAAAEPAAVPAPAPKPVAETEAAVAAPAAPVMAPAPAARNDRWVSLPLPEEGELYLRFGRPGGVSVETINGDALTYYLDPATGTLVPVGAGVAAPVTAAPAPARVTPPAAAPGTGTVAPGAATSSAAASLTAAQVQDIVRGTLAQERAAAATDSLALARQMTSFERMERMLELRLTEMEARIEAASRERAAVTSQAPAAQAPPVTVIEAPAAKPAPPVLVKASDSGGVQVPLRFVGLDPTIGYNIDDPNQFLLGLRGELARAGQPFRLLPEFLLGFGEGDTSWNFNLNAVYDLGVGIANKAYPYGGVGVGFLDMGDAELVLNFILGTQIRTTSGSFFAEYVNQDFDNNRLLAGYRVSF